MTHHTSPYGVHVPLVTPFTAAGDVAEDALEELAQAVLDAGATGLVALGTTAEASTLDRDEKRIVVETCVRVCRERGATLTIGAGTNDTRASAAALSELAQWPEAAYALVPVPYYTRPSQAGVVAHFRQLAASSPIPLIVYHIPYRTGQALDADTLHTLGRMPGIAGVKYAAGGVDQETVDLLGELPDGFAVLAGDDVFLSPLLALGAAGGIVASAHLATGRFAGLAAAWRDGDVARARVLGHGLARLSAAAFREPNPTVIKGVLHAQGRIPTPGVRLPLLPAGRGSVEATLKVLADLGE
ncbi:4-hydroxy-tetrahydrodipicolinate synthase [Planotetraspora thailandica]|uniref:4-hydroxy-tetrahydrodipicolinate synthase n=1 Tax=Planotetraspora thailandica TaxID=487172 RepID=A0A8J3XRK0_9ACTN|nr:4-hydroxy-tetrahydrodipicolinate synthase [Planotetraspora thailandica]GII52132.1 4-hydroxy-tetrahydrodipicolinate synthase [Planotetraspora thailandica]